METLQIIVELETIEPWLSVAFLPSGNVQRFKLGYRTWNELIYACAGSTLCGSVDWVAICL